MSVTGKLVRKAVDIAVREAERTAPKAERLAARYADPKSTRIADWQWRPQPEVKAELGIKAAPPHVVDYGRFMGEQADRAAKGDMGARDLLKAYGITRSSMQRQAIPLATAQKYGLDLEHLGLKEVRPEGAFSTLLGTPEGQAYLDAAQRGQVHNAAISDMAAKFRPYGFHNSLAQDLEWGARNLPQHSSEVADMVAAAREGASDPNDWVRFIRDRVRGVDAAKAGFVGAMLGRGDLPTLDARQIILQTGKPTKESAKYLSRGSGLGAMEALQRLASRMQDLNIELPPELEPFRQHLTHHAVWDKAADETTTHADVVDALKRYAKGGLVEDDATEVDPVTVSGRRPSWLDRQLRTAHYAFSDLDKLGEGARDVPGAVARSISGYAMSHTPEEFVSDVKNVGGDMAKEAWTDLKTHPLQTLGGAALDMMPFIGSARALWETAKMREEAADARAQGDERLAAILEQAAAANGALTLAAGIPGAKLAISGARRAGQLAAKRSENLAVKGARKALADKHGVDIRYEPTAPELKAKYGLDEFTPDLTPEQREANLAQHMEGSQAPKTLYHGTRAWTGEAYDPNHPTVNRVGNNVAGFYADERPQRAEGYMVDWRDNTNLPAEGSQILPVHMAIKNPFVPGRTEITAPMLAQYKAELRARNPHLSGEHGNDWIESKAAEFVQSRLPSISALNGDGMAYQRVLRAGGHDGMRDGTAWIAFEPTQIKSKFNRGTFDPNDPNMHKARGGLVKKYAEGGTVKATVKPYTPSLRERAQIGGEKLFQKVTGREPGYWDRQQIEKFSGLLDFVPLVGDTLGVDETKRALDRKQYLEGALTGLGTAVGMVPVIGDVAGGALRASAKGAERLASEAARPAIKLRGNAPHPGAAGFMEDYLKATGANPLDERARVHGDYAVTEARPSPRGIHLGDIRALQPGSGGGTRALSELKALADKHGVPIRGTAVAYHNDPRYITDTERLRDWYKAHGFEVLGGDADEGFDVHYAPTAPELKAKYGLDEFTPDLTPEQREANFARYMEGKHEVVPTDLYHGRTRDYPAVDIDAPRQVDAGMGALNTDTGWYGKGFYLSPSPSAASNYVGDVEGANVMPLHAPLRNPFIVRLGPNESGAQAMDRALTAAGAPRTSDERLLSKGLGERKPSEQTAWLKSQGHDGVVVLRERRQEDPEKLRLARERVNAAYDAVNAHHANRPEDPEAHMRWSDELMRLLKERNAAERAQYGTGEYNVNEVVAFEPTQIKSKFNRGTFDPNDPHLNKARGGLVEKYAEGGTVKAARKALTAGETR